jgi:hypothetical protein
MARRRRGSTTHQFCVCDVPGYHQVVDVPCYEGDTRESALERWAKGCRTYGLIMQVAKSRAGPEARKRLLKTDLDLLHEAFRFIEGDHVGDSKGRILPVCAWLIGQTFSMRAALYYRYFPDEALAEALHPPAAY